MLFIFEKINLRDFYNANLKNSSSFIRGIFFSEIMAGAKKQTGGKQDKSASLKGFKEGKERQRRKWSKKSRDYSHGK